MTLPWKLLVIPLLLLFFFISFATPARAQTTQPGAPGIPDVLAAFPPAVREKYKAIQIKAQALAEKYAAQGLPAGEIKKRITHDLEPDIKELQNLTRGQSTPAEPQSPATLPAAIDLPTLITQLKASATPRQMLVIDAFSQQADAPAAIPELLKLLKLANPQLDNNACLAINLILLRHPDADCPIAPLLQAVQRKTWTTQQKAAQALEVALKPDNIKGHEQEICRALIPLLTSQRSRVFRAALACLHKITGEKTGPDPDAWAAWFEHSYPGQKIDLAHAVYEDVAVVKLTGQAPAWTYTLPNQSPAPLPAIIEKLKPRADQAHARSLRFATVLVIPDDLMGKMAESGDFTPVTPATEALSALADDGCTIAPQQDEFRDQYIPKPPSPSTQPQK